MWRAFSKIFTNDRKPVKKLHLGILISIILIITALYYSRYFGINQQSSPLWDLNIFEYYTTSFGILFIIPLTYAAIFLNIRTLVITWIVCGILMIPRVVALSFHLETVVQVYIIFTLPFFISMFIKTEMTWREMQRKSAAEREEQRQKYLLQVYKAHENERKTIAMELHDSVIQSLIVLTNHAQSAITKNHGVRDSKGEKEMSLLVEEIITLRDMSREISKDIRNICLNLRPYIIDDMGLIPATRWMINRVKDNIDINLTLEGTERRFNPDTELVIYRIVQEAINNIKRHSKATKAKIKFQFYPTGLTISIEDNGQGFNFPQRMSTLTEEGKLGLIGMHERVKLLNGNIKVASQIGQGTSIVIDAMI